MNTRQKQLLNLVIENHIQTAQPIGSKFLVAEKLVDCGEATVRNELRVLEEEGYLTHPHTSAGRMPTELGYKYYLDQMDWNKIKPKKKDSEELTMAQDKTDQKQFQKNLAKILANISNETVLISFSSDSIYYTGLSNLFSKPEVAVLNLAADVSAVFDRCEDCVRDFYDQVENDIKFYVGAEHPFGSMLSVASFRFGDSLLALLGPIRMDYKRNYALLNIVHQLLNK